VIRHLQGTHIEDGDGKDRADEEVVPEQEEAVGLMLELEGALVDVEVVSIPLYQLREHVQLRLLLISGEKHSRLVK
jgi:hypothetical protein